MKSKCEKIENENEALKVQIYAIDIAVGASNVSELKHKGFESQSKQSLDKYVEALEAIKDEKTTLGRELAQVSDENVLLLRSHERLTRQAELGNLEKDDLVAQNRSISDALAEVHRRYFPKYMHKLYA